MFRSSDNLKAFGFGCSILKKIEIEINKMNTPSLKANHEIPIVNVTAL